MVYFLEDYDGSLIHERFAYKRIGKKVSNFPLGYLHVSRGKMEVTSNLIDLEDKINKDFIYSEDALSFCWEIPNLTDIGAVFFQRLFVRELTDHLNSGIYGKYDMEVHGDDLMVRKKGEEKFGKASVSITKVTDNVALGHLGININAGPKAPSFAFSFFFTESQIQQFVSKAQEIFKSILADCFVATTKVI